MIRTMSQEPERIGRYVVAGEAGRGGFASVLRAHDEVLQSMVAIKVLAANWAPDPAMRDRFVAEARMLRRADSDRVVRVHDIGELPDGRPYFVMTFADRGTLAQRLGTTPIPWRSTVPVAAEIVRALCVLHAAGILHRDIKPSNVLFRSAPGGRELLMLGDLGLGKLLGHTTGMTLLGGTPGFMAPEQGFAGAPVGVATDLYGVGAVLYRALTGRSPHDPDVVIYPASPHPAVAPSTLVPGVPPAMDQLVLRALAHDPRQRQPDAATLLADLERVLTASPAATPGYAPTPSPRPAPAAGQAGAAPVGPPVPAQAAPAAGPTPQPYVPPPQKGESRLPPYVPPYIP